MRFDNSYARLPAHMAARQDPVPVAKPELIAINAPFARDLGLDPATLAETDWVETFAGNRVPPGAEPLAQAYAGHQFGNWVHQLGDGRALLLGEHIDPQGRRWDIQLKGAGRTVFSRGGDGRAWLGPVLREYIVSEAMHALSVPTTRALAAVTTGETVWREGGLPGAILTRVASSHIRVGTFQYFAAREDSEALQALLAMVIDRHYPDASDALGVLRAAITAQANLVAQWMSLGFIHGVMNTDNAHVGGLTIDYGPCAFMDEFHPAKVFSSIDRGGRYAWTNQPRIAGWNMAQLAGALLPLIDPDQPRAIESASAVMQAYPDLYDAAWHARFGPKIGLATSRDGDMQLIEQLLTGMAAIGADFTQTFRALAEDEAPAHLGAWDGFADWHAAWTARLAAEGTRPSDARDRMTRTNPAIIPRNHRIEAAITAATTGDFAPFHALNAKLATPFDTPQGDSLRSAPGDEEVVRQTFCGT